MTDRITKQLLTRSLNPIVSFLCCSGYRVFFVPFRLMAHLPAGLSSRLGRREEYRRFKLADLTHAGNRRNDCGKKCFTSPQGMVHFNPTCRNFRLWLGINGDLV
jgi:hypothetical protein